MRYGWLPDVPDIRDRMGVAAPTQLPQTVDMRADMPPIYNQGDMNSCTGNACAAALAYARNMEGLPALTPSRLMLYYGARSLEGTAQYDVGAQIRDIIKSAAKWGACPEEVWPYDASQFAVAPNQAAYDAALKDRAIGYSRVPQNMDAMRGSLVHGNPIVLGISIYQSFENSLVAHDGVVPMPAPKEPRVGGHAIVICGYDDRFQTFTFRNSWGEGWGDRGHGYLPYDYVTNPSLADDLWTIRLTTPEDTQ